MHKLVIAGHGITHHQTVEPESPGVAIRITYTESLTMLAIDTPPDSCIPDPFGNNLDIAGCQPEFLMNYRHFQKRGYPGGLIAAAGYIQKLMESIDDRAFTVDTAVGDAERDLCRLVFRRAEHRLDKRRVLFDMGVITRISRGVNSLS
jgi:hypothetical protein